MYHQVNEDDLKEFGTLSGYLCSQAGEIPAIGDYVVVGGYMFTVTKVGFYYRTAARDRRLSRILVLHVCMVTVDDERVYYWCWWRWWWCLLHVCMVTSMTTRTDCTTAARSVRLFFILAWMW